MLATGTDGVPQEAAMYWRRRHAQFKQATRENDIYYSIILPCALRGFAVDDEHIG